LIRQSSSFAKTSSFSEKRFQLTLESFPKYKVCRISLGARQNKDGRNRQSFSSKGRAVISGKFHDAAFKRVTRAFKRSDVGINIINT